jgi:hypothetical protein
MHISNICGSINHALVTNILWSGCAAWFATVLKVFCFISSLNCTGSSQCLTQYFSPKTVYIPERLTTALAHGNIYTTCGGTKNLANQGTKFGISFHVCALKLLGFNMRAHDQVWNVMASSYVLY